VLDCQIEEKGQIAVPKDIDTPPVLIVRLICSLNSHVLEHRYQDLQESCVLGQCGDVYRISRDYDLKRSLSGCVEGFREQVVREKSQNGLLEEGKVATILEQGFQAEGSQVYLTLADMGRLIGSQDQFDQGSHDLSVDFELNVGGVVVEVEDILLRFCF
jgi:hypothetical protein